MHRHILDGDTIAFLLGMVGIKRLAAVALLSLAPVSLSTPAQADEATRTFAHDGVTYSYIVTERGSMTVLRGIATEGAVETPFTLRVRGSRVRGQVGVSEVSFALSDVEPVVGRMALASR
jgi:hypothetical protein